jgi:uncharacterized membrane protein YgcG
VSTTSEQSAGELAIPSPPELPERSSGRKWKVATAAAVVVAAGAVAVAVIDPFKSAPAATGHGIGPTELAPVTEQSLSSQTQVNATLGYARSYSVVVPGSGSSGSSSSSGLSGSSGATGSTGSTGSSSQGSAGSSGSGGTFTALPGVGKGVYQGQSLYSVDGSPVVLLYGPIPAYRTLSEGMTGTDVRSLNADLVALGYATSAELDPHSSYFSAATVTALDKLQAKLGVTQTGSLTLGQAVFLPTPARITSVAATVSAPAQPGTQVLQASSNRRLVTAQVDATLQPDVKAGDTVSITLPNNQTTPGVVSSVGTVATNPNSSSSGSSSSGSSSSSSSSSGGSGTATIQVNIKPTQPSATGDLTSAPAQVTITTATVHHALVVQVDALLAMTSGAGYAVEVAGANGARHLVPVSLGLFDDADGLVQVTSPHLSAGQEVVVPKI